MCLKLESVLSLENVFIRLQELLAELDIRVGTSCHSIQFTSQFTENINS